MRGLSTTDNPGAFQARQVRGPRGIASAAARSVRRGRYRTALLDVFVDVANLFEASVGRRLPPRYRCSCCGHEAHAFHHLSSHERVAWNSACPACDSRSRHRGLAIVLPTLLAELKPRRVLHFAPEPVLQRSFAAPDLQYDTADLFLSDVTYPNIDIRALPFANGHYDLIVCNHVLEHIDDDTVALAELARVLSPRGLAVITVPGDFSRPETEHFTGPLVNGHFRHYGADFIDRLRGVFAGVDVLDLHELDHEPDGFSRAIRERDLAFLCRSTGSAASSE